MKIIIFELRAHIKSFIFWSLGMIFLIYSGMAKLQAYEQSGQSIHKLFDSMPAIFKALFGITNFGLNTAKGFFVMLFLYILFLAGLYSAMLGSEIVSKESRDKTNEFLLSKPLSRSAILSQKMLTGLLILIAFWLVSICSSILFLSLFNNGESITNDIAFLGIGLFAVMLFFYSSGLFFATASPKQKSATILASSIVLVSYLLFVVYKLVPELTIIKYLSVFEIFEAGSILQNGYSVLGALITTIAVSLFVIFSFINYKNKDQNY
jgi:ABC-2 type transport system permease protein